MLSLETKRQFLIIYCLYITAQLIVISFNTSLDEVACGWGALVNVRVQCGGQIGSLIQQGGIKATENK